MRRYAMYDASRGLTLALAAGLTGLGLWGAAQVGTQTQGRFWISMVIVAAGGFLIALATHVGTWTKGLRMRLSPGTFVFAFLPVLVCVGWILIAMQPGTGWEEGRIHSWSDAIGILGAVHSIGLWSGVLAFGFGLMLGLSLDGVPAEEPAVDEGPAYSGERGMPARSAADEPVSAERHYAARGTTPPSMADDTAQTRERTPTR